MQRPTIITHLSRKYRSPSQAIEGCKKEIQRIIGNEPNWFWSGGPVKHFKIGKSSDGRTGVSHRASNHYIGYHAIVILYETDGKDADRRVDNVEKDLIDHFSTSKRCQNQKQGGGKISRTSTSRSVYVALKANEDEIEELRRNLSPSLAQ